MKWLISMSCALALLTTLVIAQDKTDEKAADAKAEPKAAEKAADEKAAEPIEGEGELKSVKDKVSYGIGLNIGRNMARDGVEIDVDLLARGIRDALAKNKPLITDQEIQTAIIAFQQELAAKSAEREKVAAAKNKEEGATFLAENKAKDGVKTTPSGLQYKVIKSGDGASPQPSDTVSVHYKGTLIDGTQFDSSYDRGQPARFQVNRVIKGWTEALQIMKPGDKWILYIPSDLAYGAAGAGADIGPHATLIFEVELLDVVKGAPAP